MIRADLSGRLANSLFRELWQNYRGQVSDVPRIEDALRALGEFWHEDHVAFRTLPGEHCGAHVLQGMFELLGYQRRDSYEFKDKRLSAFWMEPPSDKGTLAHLVLPKVFISELQVEMFTSQFCSCVKKYTNQVHSSPLAEWKSQFNQLTRSLDFSNTEDSERSLFESLKASMVAYLSEGPGWQRPMFTDYQLLLRESEYGAWTLVFGPIPNHFTVSVYLMKRFSSLDSFNEFVTEHLAVRMNQAGGQIIKGSPLVGLEQSATLACHVPVLFQDGVRRLPYAFVEFAFRHPLEGNCADGQWGSYYQGFVTENADKIFESTYVNVRQP